MTSDKGSLSSFPRDLDECECLKRTRLVSYSGALESELDSLSESEIEPASDSDSESKLTVRECHFLREWESP